MSVRVFITGMGVISAIGNNLPETLTSLELSRTGISFPEYLETAHNQLPVAEVKLSNSKLAEISRFQPENGVLCRTTLLGLAAAREAVSMSGITKENLSKAGLISATTVGGMCLSEQHYKNVLETGENRQYIDSFDSADSTETIAKQLGIFRNVSTINTACSSSANAIMLAARLIKAGRAKRMLAGGTDALSRFTINGFNALEILDPEHCKPFDAGRRGLNIGEGAAFLMLESEDVADENRIIAEVCGYSNANDAFHPTASSPEGVGAILAMQQALANAGITAEKIDYINAHGTGTDINDISEGRAIQSVFASNIPFVSSTKAFTGHTLGAAGVIEAVISALCIHNKFVPANLNFRKKIAELSFTPVKAFKKDIKVSYVMSNSLGFGGNSSTLIIGKK